MYYISEQATIYDILMNQMRRVYAEY